jgi:hypothetical protein
MIREPLPSLLGSRVHPLDVARLRGVTRRLVYGLGGLVFALLVGCGGEGGADESAGDQGEASADGTEPLLTVVEPTSGQTTEAASLRIAGSATDETAMDAVRLQVNDEATYLLASGGGTTLDFERSIPLQEGANQLRFEAEDAAGNTTAEVRNVTRTEAAGGGGGPPSESPLADALAEPLGAAIPCPNLSLTPSAAPPGTTVTVNDMPADLDEPGFRVIADTPQGQRVDPLFVHANPPDGAVRFTVPVHPTRDPDGGEVMLELGDGTGHCPPQPFRIEPMPEAPADYAETVRLELEAWVDQTLEVLGYDPAQLAQAEAARVPEPDRPLWLAKQLVSGSGAAGLSRLAEQAASDGDRYLERLLMAADLAGDLNEARLELDTVPIGQRPTANAPARAIKRVPWASQRAEGPSRRPQVTGCEERAFEAEPLSITTAAQLAARMQAAQDGYLFDGSTSGWLLGGAALADHRGTGTAAGVAGAAVYVVKTVEQARRALEPQSIVAFEVDRATTRWVEDRPPSLPGRWEGATVTAEGAGFNLAKATLEGLITAVGLIPGPVGSGVTAATVVSPDGVNAGIDALTGDSCFRIQAPRYGPINVNDAQWTRAEITGGSVEQVTHRTYKGVDIGASELLVALRGERFATRQTFEERFTIQVEELILSLIPTRTRVQEPGEVVDISATAANAYTRESNFFAEVLGGDGFGRILDQRENGAFYDVRVETTEARERYPALVRFEAQHRTLPEGAGKRTVTAEIDVRGAITVTPRAACLIPSSEIDLTAELSGFRAGNDSVTWTRTDGRLSGVQDRTATLVAPGQPGRVSVTATSDADPEVSDTVTYTVSETCLKKIWYPVGTLTLDGNGSYSLNTSDRCPADQREAEQVAQFATVDPLQPPAIPPDTQLWFDRNESIAADFAHSSSRHVVDDQDTPDPGDDTCSTVGLTGSHTGSIQYGATADGTLSFRLESDLKTRCDTHSNDAVSCSSGGAVAGATGAYYIEVPTAVDYRIQGELRCEGLTGNVVTQVPITATVLRFQNGTEPFEPAPDIGTGVSRPDGAPRSPQLFSLRCPEADQTLPFDIPFTLDAPLSASDTDLAIIQLSGTIQVLPASAPDFAPPDPGGGAIPQPPTPPAPGEYQSGAEIELTIQVQPR